MGSVAGRVRDMDDDSDERDDTITESSARGRNAGDDDDDEQADLATILSYLIRRLRKCLCCHWYIN